jgi:hypothetical protein
VARRGAVEARAALLALLGTTLFVVPLHLYDLSPATLALVLVPGPWIGAALLALNLALVRVNLLAGALGLLAPASRFPGSHLASLVLAALFVLAALGLAQAARRSPHPATAPR